MSQPNHREPPLARLVGRRPTKGAAGAAKAVISDVQELLRAEIALAKAEIADGVKSKVLGAAFFIVAAVIGWLAIQVFLVFLGFLFALFLPGWAAVGLVLLLLLIAIGVLGFLGYRKLQAEASLKQAKASMDQSKQAATAAIEQAKTNAKDGVEEAKAVLAETAKEVKERVDERRGKTSGAGQLTAPSSPSLPATSSPTPNQPVATNATASTESPVPARSDQAVPATGVLGDVPPNLSDQSVIPVSDPQTAGQPSAASPPPGQPLPQPPARPDALGGGAGTDQESSS